MSPTPVYKALRRRGEGSPYTGTQTSFPTSPPSSTHHHGIPEIAGSEGGFLGLVIGLGVLFIGCSIAVWLLLRRRNQEGRKPLPFVSKWFGGKGGTKDRSIPSGGFNRLGPAGNHGWVRTGGDDDSDDEHTGKASGRKEYKLGNVRARSPNPSSPRPEREGLYTNDSNPFATPSTLRFQDQPGPYGDAFTTRPSTDSLDDAVHRGQYQATSTRDHDNDEPPTFASPPTSPFKDGTKFKETF